MFGWNEPEKLSVHSVEVKVDAALIAQLRAGYSELSGPKRVCDARDALCAPVGGGCRWGSPRRGAGTNLSESMSKDTGMRRT